ncbi:MAG: YhdP family protein [Gammaproteobacteria bacterium]
MTDRQTHRLLDKLFNAAWLLLAAAAVLVAVYVVVGGQLLAVMSERRADIAAWAGVRIGMHVEIDNISGGMRRLTPEVRLRGVRVGLDDADEPALVAPSVDARIDVLASALARRPVLQSLRIDGLELTLIQEAGGRLRVKGFPFDVDDPRAAERLEQALGVLYRQRDVVVTRARILFEGADLPVTSLAPVSVHMHNDGDEHRVGGQMTVEGAGRLPFSFVAHFSGRPMTPAEWEADIYLRMHSSPLEGWLSRRDAGPLWLESLSAGGEVWLHMNGLRVTRASGRAGVDSLAVSRTDGAGRVEGLLGLSTRFGWEEINGGWRLSLGGLEFRRQGRRWPEADAALEWRVDASGKRSLRTMLTRGSVEMLSGFSDLLPPGQEAWGERIARMAPRGQVGPVYLHWDEARPVEERWWLSAEFAQLALRADGALPGATGLSGHVELGPEAGHARLRARRSRLEMPALFGEPLPMDEADARLYWERAAGGGWQVLSGPVAIANADARASASFALSLPADGASPQLQLLGLVSDGDVRATPRYLPLTIREPLRDWLVNALVDGRLLRASFLFDGPVGREPAQLARRTFQMRFEGEGATIAFLPEWPSLTRADADVLVEDGRVTAQAGSAFLRDSRLSAIRVDVMPDAPSPARLRVRTIVDGDLADMFALFEETPLRKVVPAELLRWQGAGRMAADVRVDTALAAGAPVQVTVAGRVDGATLSSVARNLEISDTSGELRFDTADGFSARNLRGRALGSEFSGDAATRRIAGRQQTQVNLRGRLDTASLREWLQMPALDVLRGNADATLMLAFGGTSGTGELEVRSNLRGISSTAPVPLAKPAQGMVDTRLTLTLGTDEPRFTLSSGRALSADLRLRNGVPVAGMVALGATRLRGISGEGLVIEGDLQRLVLDDWSAFIARLAGTAPATAGQPVLARAIAGIAGAGEKLQRVNIEADQLVVGDFVLDKAGMRMGREEGGWLVRVDSPVLRAQAVLPDGYQERGDKPLVVQVESLRLEAGVSGASFVPKPTDVPRMALSLNGMRMGGEDLGAWSMETVPVEGGVELRDVHGAWRALDIRGQGAWLATPAGTQSRFSGEARADDLSRVSVAFGFQPALSSSSALARLELTWPGWPPAFDPAQTTGNLLLDVRDGRFVTESARTQALRAFGIFNINTWQRRLKFDFSDLYRKGVAFDTLTGDFALEGGRLTTRNLVAKGPSALFEMSGTTALDTYALDGRLRVTLPLNSNLYVGCLAGLAACAGIVAFEQLWGDRLEKMTTLVYEVGGTWQDPLVKEVAGAQAPGG